jgi:hypothetical protein
LIAPLVGMIVRHDELKPRKGRRHRGALANHKTSRPMRSAAGLGW